MGFAVSVAEECNFNDDDDDDNDDVDNDDNNFVLICRISKAQYAITCSTILSLLSSVSSMFLSKYYLLYNLYTLNRGNQEPTNYKMFRFSIGRSLFDGSIASHRALGFTIIQRRRKPDIDF